MKQDSWGLKHYKTMILNLIGGKIWRGGPHQGGLGKTNLQIRDGKIFKISKKLPAADKVIDITGLVVFPGFIDSHVHFRDFQQSYKEDWRTGSLAAAAGGVTTVIDMPNNQPPMLTTKDLEKKYQLARKKSVVNFAFHFGSSEGNLAEIDKIANWPRDQVILNLFQDLKDKNEMPNQVRHDNLFLGVVSIKVYMNETTGQLKIDDQQVLAEIFRSFPMIAAHAEGEKVKEAIKLIKRTPNKLYLCHIASKDEIDYLRKHKIKGKIFIEVTPHHLFLTKDSHLRGVKSSHLVGEGFWQMKPSLKSQLDQDALWQAIRDDLVDTIATDHAPHTIEEKNAANPPFGVPGVETMLPLLFNAYHERKITLEKIVQLCSTNPARIFGFKTKGKIQEGLDADLTMVDLNLTKKVSPNELKTKCGWSPYEKWQLKGWPVMTIIGGQVVFDKNGIFANLEDKRKRAGEMQNLECRMQNYLIKNNNMNRKPNLTIEIAGIKWQNPVTVASGTYGIDWPMSKNLDEKKLGALTVKTITLEPRQGHQPPTMVKTDSGMLNAVGLKNPGLDKFLEEELPLLKHLRGERSSQLVGGEGLQLIVSIAGKTEDEYLQLAKALDKEKAIDYLEINVSCPNVRTGLAFGTDPYLLEQLTRKIRQVTSKPIIVKLSPNVTDIVACARAAEKGGASAIALINTLLGMVINLETRKPVLTNNLGGLSGPAIKPVALRMVYQTAQAVKIPIIAMGGITKAQDALEFIMVGATAVSVGTANFTDPAATSKIVRGIEDYLVKKNISDINELRGTLVLNGDTPSITTLRADEQERSKMNFLDWLKTKQRENESLVCVGLDTSIDKLPEHLSKDNEGAWQFNKAIIDATHDQVCAYKPNLAFYEADNTLDALKKTVRYAHKKGIPIIADAKRGDIGNTAEAYARAIFDNFGFDAVTVNAYMGHDGVEPFSNYKDKGVIVVTRSSNPSAKDLQDIKDQNGKPIYMNMLEKVLEWNSNGNLLMVAGATYPEELGQMRQAAPHLTFLVPGIGKQGGDVANTVQNGLDEEGLGMIINNARGIIYASSAKDFAQVAQAETIKMKNEINKYRKAKLILELFAAEAVKFGNFTLKSGLKSPIYIDLRPLVSYPQLMQKIAKELAKIIENIKWDVLAGVPYTALPITVHLSSLLNKPMIYARKESKDYGTARKIEGVFKEGDRCLIIDDMITDGASKLENIGPIEKAGMKVKDVVVVLDRQQGGDKKLKEKGYQLTSLFKLTEVLEILRDCGKITPEKYQQAVDYLKETQVK